ncbi:hypothetical protein BOC55_35205 [Burkholderia pseudomallei]|nr:hypothetical protein BOC36_24740 [Burkholderia pseudomallei]ARL25463.1 hypothetical protein BOC47_24120 [Burkholderia pseudomallei]ARL77575.1 hypothetical protein BOC54_36880 [Burkholderia pseudomallei]ARL84180.1 hypothetical protein BOC55_35205 [Burkholderia pseudomallei]
MIRLEFVAFPRIPIALRTLRAMRKLLRHRSYLRRLSRRQRRAWFEQWKNASPRVRISGAYLPQHVTRSFTYVKLWELP